MAALIWNDALVPKDGTLGESYFTAVHPILDQQLALAGVRLARFLNEAAGAGCGTASIPGMAAPSGEAGLQSYANVGDAKAQAKAYHAPGIDGSLSHYQRDQAAVGEAAIAYVTQRAASVAKPAIVLDIDETSLDNWLEIAANDFGYIPDGECDLDRHMACGVKAWEGSKRAPAIASTLNLFKVARRLGVAVFFITGRNETLRVATEDNLKRAGYDGWTQVVMETAGAHPPSAADFKAPERARIVMRGYTVLANVGDQPSDLAGGYAERSFLMPNPFYRIP
jgi:acid phosphatase